MLFEWNESFEIGIQEIDDDHKALVNLMNDLYEAMQDGSGGALLIQIFSALKDYTETHFAKEERIMAQWDVPGQKQHFQEHQKMIAKLSELENRHRKGEAAISLQTLTFLRDWLRNHICVLDQTMAETVEAKALSKDK